MSNNNYDRIVYLILNYLFSCFKGETSFEEVEFFIAIGRVSINDVYYHNILSSLIDEEYVEGINYTKTLHRKLVYDLSEIMITPKGIHYLYDEKKKGNKWM